MNSLSFQNNISLSTHTTIQLGGPARQFVTVTSIDELRAALEYATKNSLRTHILGGGSNTIFPQAGFNGLVIHVQIVGTTQEMEGESVRIRVGAGEVWDTFVVSMIEQGLAGIECLSGIPGYVGATPMQNVGAYGQEVAETITKVEALDRTTGDPVSFANDECAFAYRFSRFKGKDANRYVITHVEYALKKNGEPTAKYEELQKALAASPHYASATTPQERLHATRAVVLSLRKKKSMVVDPNDPNTRSCGSFFMNAMLSPAEFKTLQQHSDRSDIPFFDMGEFIKVPAAWLIEQAGFTKGFRHKGAGISSNHTLALVNYGGTTDDLLELANMIEQKVQDTFGIPLHREPVVIT